MSADIQNPGQNKKAQAILLSCIFNTMTGARQDSDLLQATCLQISNPGFEETIQDQESGNNVLHQAALAGPDVFETVKATLEQKWEKLFASNAAGDAQNRRGVKKHNDVFTTGEVAKICSVAPRTVSKWFDSGKLKGYKIPGSRDRRITKTALVSFMKSHNVPTDALIGGGALEMQKRLMAQLNKQGKTPADLIAGPSAI